MSSVTPNRIKQSPKTPGGISKSLLTPCRRVGLSRKWKKGGCSPFISPLGAQNTTPETEKQVREDKKRRKCTDNDQNEVNNMTTKHLDTQDESSECSPMPSTYSNKSNDITSTPCRNSQIPRKKSKILSLKNSQETEKDELDSVKQLQPDISFRLDAAKIEVNDIQEKTNTKTNIETNTKIVVEETEPTRKCEVENVSKLTRTGSKSRNLSLKKSLSKTSCKDTEQISNSKVSKETAKPKEKSPNNLTKECIVVIQNKILKTNPHITNETQKVVPDADSELDVPLSSLKRKSIESVTLNTLSDEDFISKPNQKKARSLSLKKNKTSNPTVSNSNSQSSQEEDRKTILVKKTYEKVTKPEKAKSTGSITQKDIEELKARIEMKKKLLLAKSMEGTEELRGLIKKWQKGCQNALMELLDLMKKKLPDRQNMGYAEILETLKIPTQLVGYDSDNDCFVTPDDTNVLVSTFKL